MRGSIEYHSDGINITISKTETAIEYRDTNNVGRTRFDKQLNVHVSINSFTFISGDLTELCFAKSCVQFFVQSSWRSKTKKGLSKIELVESLDHEDGELWFFARQKDQKNYLQIVSYIKETGKQEIIYLSVRESMMLDMALGKAMGSMQASADPEYLVTIGGDSY